MLEAIIELHSFLPLARWRHRFHHHFPCWGLWEFGFHVDVHRRKGILRCLLWAVLGDNYWLTLTIRVHQFFELSCVLDLKENFLSILYKNKEYLRLDLKVELFSRGSTSHLLQINYQTYNQFCYKPPKNTTNSERSGIQIQYSSEILL